MWALQMHTVFDGHRHRHRHELVLGAEKTWTNRRYEPGPGLFWARSGDTRRRHDDTCFSRSVGSLSIVGQYTVLYENNLAPGRREHTIRLNADQHNREVSRAAICFIHPPQAQYPPV